MSDNQRFVLNHMMDRNIGAIFVPGHGYCFMQAFRDSSTLADKVAAIIATTEIPK